jgi:hypothetical protein
VRRTGTEIAAALSALATYAFTVLPRLRRELVRWRREAAAISDPARRRQALSAIEEKAANVQAVAVFAVLAPRKNRQTALRAIVSLQVAIDYEDSLDEAGVATRGSPAHDGYLARLQTAWREEVSHLPGAGPAGQSLEQAVARCEEGQRWTHAAERGDVGALEGWSRSLAEPCGYCWWELAAGASSSVAAHALIAIAAAPNTTQRQAELVDAAYNPAIGALTVLLDDLVDREQDHAGNSHNYTRYYADAAEAAERIAAIGRHARREIRPLPHRRRHAAILAGVAAYYLSDSGARDDFGQVVAAALRRTLGPSVRALAIAVTVARCLGALADTGA